MQALNMTTLLNQARHWLTPRYLTLTLWGVIALVALWQGMALLNTISVTNALDEDNLPGWFDDLPERVIDVEDELLVLFGEYDQEWQVLALNTTLPLELKGIFFSTDTGETTVAISAPGTVEQTYAIGARLPGDAILYAIEADHILLQRDGYLERLGFADEDNLLTELSQPINQSQLDFIAPGYQRIE